MYSCTSSFFLFFFSFFLTFSLPTTFSSLYFFHFPEVFLYAAKFNQTWCNKLWAVASNKNDFLWSNGLSFCCFPGTFFDSSTRPATRIESSNDGSFQCIDCLAGFITTSPNTLTTCEPCEQGKYQDEDGQFKCKACEPGKWSDVESLAVESGCIDCVSGKYSKPNGADSIDACVDCQPGKKGDATKTGADDESSCTPCKARTYSNQGGQTSCQNCGDNETSKSGSTFCTPSGSKMCDMMDDGSSGCTNSQATFEACTAGTYGEVPPTSQCLKCPTGYSSSKAATECQPWYVLLTVFLFHYCFYLFPTHDLCSPLLLLLLSSPPRNITVTKESSTPPSARHAQNAPQDSFKIKIPSPALRAKHVRLGTTACSRVPRRALIWVVSNPPTAKTTNTSTPLSLIASAVLLARPASVPLRSPKSKRSLVGSSVPATRRYLPGALFQELVLVDRIQRSRERSTQCLWSTTPNSVTTQHSVQTANV